jgi:prolyl oligopeptidase
MTKITSRVLMCALAVSALITSLSAQKLQYPDTKKVDHADTYFGVKVPDPYRWLEDETSAETKQWVEAQNKVTFGYLDSIPYRQHARARVRKLYEYARYTAPYRRGDYYFFSKNDGLQNQSVVYVQKGLEGTPEVLIDPNTFSKGGTTQLGALSISKNAKYAAYCKAIGGSDWRDCYVMEVATRKTLADELKWVKVSGLAWSGDGFFYSRYDAPAKGKELSAVNEGHKVYYHRVGTPQSADALVYEDKANPQRFHNVTTTEDQKFAILNVSERGKGKDGNALFFRSTNSSDTTWKPIVADIGNDSYGVVDNVGDRFLIETNAQAPNSKVMLFDPAKSGAERWREILPEKTEPIQGVNSAGGKLFVTYLKDVTSRAYVYSLDGRLENEVQLPAAGIASGFGGQDDDKFTFYTVTSFTYPTDIFRYDIATRKSTLFRSAQVPGFRPQDYETKQVFFTSKDGTRVPMFLVHKKGVQQDGKNPTLMYGYGGFNSAVTPGFSPSRIALLEQGFVYASVNMRGGSEYGEKWHKAGMKLNKQNVFDDFIAAAEWLIANKYTSPERLAIQGASNGGLLVGAVANQRPELFKAVIQQAGVMDMLRFHKFTIGWNWIADYGSSDDEAEFKVLHAYSPIHNVRPGVKYPATLTTTADHDDRVVPAHSFKYAAALQAAHAGDAPVLIRIDTTSAHGASNTDKAIEQAGDIHTFLFHNLGVVPQYGTKTGSRPDLPPSLQLRRTRRSLGGGGQVGRVRFE